MSPRSDIQLDSYPFKRPPSLVVMFRSIALTVLLLVLANDTAGIWLPLTDEVRTQAPEPPILYLSNPLLNQVISPMDDLDSESWVGKADKALYFAKRNRNFGRVMEEAMSLNAIHYEHDGRSGWGIVRNGRIAPVPGNFVSTSEFLAHTSPEDLANLQEGTLTLSDVTLLSPVTRHQQFICQGANYRQHMLESGMDPDDKTFNMVFRKASSCMTGANSDLVRPPHVSLLDYEIELGVIVKRDICAPVTVTDHNLHEFIAGIVIVNDYSARDVQIPQMQFYKGKSYRTFGPVGPYLCLLEPTDMHYLKKLELHLTVNGETRQRDSTANLVFGPTETLTELSGVQDLYRGDLIATGTPSGCALRIPSSWMVRVAGLLPESTKWKLFLSGQAKRGNYLRNGDVVESRIHSPDGRIDLGMQTNKVVGAAS